ncbi:nuclease domain-containing protein [Fictibacillus barbaricus]|uniref:C2H2-type domain-containing protein n=1 Tax=Fictibacillus barbaricus TaxID=182136 RepID=A0ABU1U5R7_9BACL|nr:nuclease domain-containing protein [Fictibacillus barbaricus]MDR7074721.1 hypothetical protein [Fictibacillus barbaricus]
MKLIPYMIYVDYNHTVNLLADKTLPVKSIVLGEKIKYDNTNNFWYTQNHYRATVKLDNETKTTRFFQIGFKLLDCNDNRVTVQYKSIRSENNTILTYDNTNEVWYQKSKFENSKSVNKFIFSKRTDDFLRGLNHSGQLNVGVYSGLDLLLSEKILFFPSSIPVSQYNIMISDLFRIRESLIKNEKIDISVNTQKTKTIDKLENIVKDIEAPLKYINRFPATNLSIKKAYVKEALILRYDPQTEIQKIINPGKSKYKTQVNIDNSAIYENKIIKQQLEKIWGYSKFFSANSNLVDADKIQSINEAKSIILKGSPRIRNYVNYYGGIDSIEISSLEFITQKIESDFKFKNNEIIERQNWISTILKRNKFQRSKRENYSEVPIKLKLRVSSDFYEKNLKINKDSINVMIKSGKSQENNVPPILFVGYEYYYNKKWNEPILEKHSMFCELETNFLSNNELLLLLKALEECGQKADVLGKEIDININGYVILNKNIMHAHSTEDILGIPSNNPWRNKYKFIFKEIVSIGLNETEYILLTPETQKINELSRLLLSYDFYIQEIEERKDQLELEKQTMRQITQLLLNNIAIQEQGERYQNLANKIESYLRLEIFKGIQNIDYEPIRPTQLFLHDPNYKKVWKSLNDIEEEIGASLIPDNKKRQLGVKKVDEIFEIWSLMKMINMLTGLMGWTILNKKILIDSIDTYLTSNRKLKGFSIELELDIWRIELTYEAKVNLEGNAYREPDYRFIFKGKNNWGQFVDIGVVYLDAKYRNYKEQDKENFGENEWSKDIKDIAIERYGNLLHKNKPHLKTIASFIIHPDIELGMRKETKGENYFAFYNRNQFPKSIDNQRNEEIHKYGSIYFLPISTHSFKNWFRMIMEYKLNLFEKCWTCGEHNNINKIIKYTGKGYPKYHYQCRECNEFWVKNHCRQHGHKLIKHVNNYHRQPSVQYEWYVVCPACGDGFQFEK